MGEGCPGLPEEWVSSAVVSLGEWGGGAGEGDWGGGGGGLLAGENGRGVCVRGYSVVLHNSRGGEGALGGWGGG